MATTLASYRPVTVTESDLATLQRMAGLLRRAAPGEPRLASADGEVISLPSVVHTILHEVVESLLSGQAVSLVSIDKELTTQQAADLLNMSRPHLIALLERGEIPYTRTGTHRRIKYKHVMAYQRQREREADEALDELARLSYDLGLYSK